MPRSFFQMLLSRLSPPGARLYATTNPDNPNHYVKTELIDNADLTPYVRHIAFTLDDNPNLDPVYKDSLKRQYSGLFYKRFIQGLWVAAEGAIYANSLTDENYFDEASRPVGLYGQGGYIDHYIAIDYGTTNPCVFLEILDDGRVLWVIREYYWDSKAQFQQRRTASTPTI